MLCYLHRRLEWNLIKKIDFNSLGRQVKLNQDFLINFASTIIIGLMRVASHKRHLLTCNHSHFENDLSAVT